MRKTICFIRSNPVDPDSRVEKEAATLKKSGYNVLILAWDRNSDHKCRQEFIEVYGEKIEIYRIGHKAAFGAGMKSIIPYLRFQIDQLIWLIRNRNRIDAIHSCDFDTALFSTFANFFIRKKYVFDIFDFICGNPKNLFEKLIKRVQLSIINKSDATIICTEKRRQQIALAKPKKIVIIHNTPITNSSELVRESNNLYGVLKIVYVGILQDHRLLLEISNYIKDNPQYELHVGGFGKYEEYFRKLSDNYRNIYFYGKLPYDKTIELETECDIMLAIYDPSIENHVYAAPNKFYESLMLGKPVIMVKGTGMSEYVEEYGIGVTIDYSTLGFQKGLEQISCNINNWNDISIKMKKLYDTEFNWRIMENRLLEMYYQLFDDKD